MPITLVNPMNETVREQRKVAPKLDTLSGKIIGLLDISKPGGSVFLDRLETLLRERFGVEDERHCLLDALAAHGLGHEDIDVVVLSILIYALLGKLADSASRALERLTLSWHPAFQKH